jgi:tetratricopeptide (TPR) repeat protein
MLLQLRQLTTRRRLQELKARNIAHARNLYDRAVTLLPRVDGLWLKFVQLEELLQNIGGARQVFERWMKWEPDDRAWKAYVKLELRYNEFERASAVHERWIGCHPEPKNWIEWARFEEERGAVGRSFSSARHASDLELKPLSWPLDILPSHRLFRSSEKAREVFQMALEFFGDKEAEVERAQSVFAAFARMETRLKEFDRARVIYKVRPLVLLSLRAAASLTPLIAPPVRARAPPAEQIAGALLCLHQIREAARQQSRRRVNRPRQAADPVRGGDRRRRQQLCAPSLASPRADSPSCDRILTCVAVSALSGRLGVVRPS